MRTPFGGGEPAPEPPPRSPNSSPDGPLAESELDDSLTRGGCRLILPRSTEAVGGAGGVMCLLIRGGYGL